MADFSDKDDRAIENWIDNYEQKKATSAPFYRELLEERARRAQAKSRLNIERSLACLKAAAEAGSCTTYGDLAKASNVPWAQARHAMNGPQGHLDRLLDICHARGLPLLTALCVNQAGLSTGELEPDALKGFVAGARRLGFTFLDDHAFHHEQRDASWKWGKIAASP